MQPPGHPRTSRWRSSLLWRSCSVSPLSWVFLSLVSSIPSTQIASLAADGSRVRAESAPGDGAGQRVWCAKNVLLRDGQRPRRERRHTATLASGEHECTTGPVADPPGQVMPSNPLRERALAAPLPHLRARPSQACQHGEGSRQRSLRDRWQRLRERRHAGQGGAHRDEDGDAVRDRASTGRPRASTATITKAARSASPTKIGLKAPGGVPFLRAISWAPRSARSGPWRSLRRGTTRAGPRRTLPFFFGSVTPTIP